MQINSSNLIGLFLYYFVSWAVTLLGTLVLLAIYQVNPATQSATWKEIPWFFGYIILDFVRIVGFAHVILHTWSRHMSVRLQSITRWRVFIACIGLLSPVCLIDLQFDPCFRWIIPLYVCCSTFQSLVVLLKMYTSHMLSKQFCDLELSIQESTNNVEIITIVYSPREVKTYYTPGPIKTY